MTAICDPLSEERIAYLNGKSTFRSEKHQKAENNNCCDFFTFNHLFLPVPALLRNIRLVSRSRGGAVKTQDKTLYNQEVSQYMKRIGEMFLFHDFTCKISLLKHIIIY